MKLKVQLDLPTVKEFLLNHVEKLGLGAAVLIAVLLVYSALGGMESFNRTPEQLIQAVNTSQKTIENTPPDSGLAVTDYVSRVKRGRIPIREEHYVTDNPWDNPLFEKKPLRGTPQLLIAESLRVKADVAACQMIAETPAADGATPVAGGVAPMAGGSETRGQRWIALTALVPITRQEKEYNKTFRGSLYPDPQNDIPKYLGYWVERLEVPSANEAGELDWSKAKKVVSKQEIDIRSGQWSGMNNSDVVPNEYLDSALVFPLPPVVNKQWTDAVAHPPEVPLSETLQPGMGMGMMGPPGMPPPGGGMPGPRAPRGMMEPGMGMPPGMTGGRSGNPDDIFNPNDPNTQQQPTQVEQKPIDHLLLRFFDFDVQPGKCYVYRVRLALTNPNYGLKETLLSDPAQAKLSRLETDWSAPSPAIQVPGDTRVLLVSVKPGNVNVDPSAVLMLVKWVNKRGFEANYKVAKAVRGMMLNFANERFNYLAGGNMPQMPPGGMMGPPGGMMPPEMAPPAPGGARGGARAPAGRGAMPDAPPMPGDPAAPRGRDRGRAPRGNPPDPMMEPGGMMGPPMGGGLPGGQGTPYKVNFYAQSVAVDFRGGARLTNRSGGTLTMPGEMLLLDANGNLVVCDEIDDKAEVERIESIGRPPEGAPPIGGGGVRPGGLDDLFGPGGAPKRRGGT